MFHGHLNCFQKPLLGGRSNTRPGDHVTPNAHNRWFILFYRVGGSTWMEIHWNIIWLRARSRMTSHYTWGPVTRLHDFGGVSGPALDTFLLGSHYFMVTALGPCVKWPSSPLYSWPNWNLEIFCSNISCRGGGQNIVTIIRKLSI